MNHLMIIGNLTKDPTMNTLQSGDEVCSFTVAVNRRKRTNNANGQPDADFFRVSAWNELGKNCHRFLSKGKKVCVIGNVSSRIFEGSDGTKRASLEVRANDVEFLTPRSEGGEASPEPAQAAPAPAAAPVPEQDDLPF